MATIVTREVGDTALNRPLTNAEMDNNLINLNNELAEKQTKLVSGTSLKSINGVSLLGSGDISLGVTGTYYNLRDHAFGSETTTTLSGVRMLTNFGEGADVTLYSGQGLDFNGTNQYISAGYVAPQQEGTVLFNFKYQTGQTNDIIIGIAGATGYLLTEDGQTLLTEDNQPLEKDGSNDRNYIGLNTAGKLGIGINTKTYDTAGMFVDEVLTNNASYNVAMVYAGKAYTLYVNGVVKLSGVETGWVTPSGEIYLGSLPNGSVVGNYFDGILKDVYYIPQALTAQEVNLHFQNPEKTLYRDNAVLKSSFLVQATIDSMTAGSGFWYPLCENVEVGSYAKDNVGDVLKPITNYTSTMRTNAQSLNWGMQQALLKKDGFGSPIGLTDSGELMWDGKSYSDLLNQNISGDWEADIYAKIDEPVSEATDIINIEVVNYSGSRIGNVSVFSISNSSNLFFWNTSTSTSLGVNAAVITLVKLGNTFRVYCNNELVGTNTISDWHSSKLKALSANENYTGLSNSTTGTLQVSPPRSDAKRLSDINALKFKHGVY